MYEGAAVSFRARLNMKAAQQNPAVMAQESGHELADRYREVRAFTERLCQRLELEDYVIQSMPDVSPTKWHLAHTTWFFESFVLNSAIPNRRVNPEYQYLFNSYYNTLGPMHCRAKRGMLSRPTVNETFHYRQQVDREILSLLDDVGNGVWNEIRPLAVLGLHHEQQHQELVLTDIKHVFSQSPLNPVYHDNEGVVSGDAIPLSWKSFPEGLHWIGCEGDGFYFDNEGPRHRSFIEAFQLACRPVTNGDYIEFIEDGGYQRAEFWLSEGWAKVGEERWDAPLYWEQRDGHWYSFTLSGMKPVEAAAPVCHVSYFEADAYARWAGARLPTEEEWEVASANLPLDGNFVESGSFHPLPGRNVFGNPLQQMFGDVWEWTSSAYSAYPGYHAPEGALGEYNGKFMCGQYVLRGGSCVTPRSHIRRTYRNFFAPDKRWQFSGIRLARDIQSNREAHPSHGNRS
jgi:ergothioneine biosynthesis protein EgtB